MLDEFFDRGRKTHFGFPRLVRFNKRESTNTLDFTSDPGIGTNLEFNKIQKVDQHLFKLLAKVAAFHSVDHNLEIFNPLGERASGFKGVGKLLERFFNGHETGHRVVGSTSKQKGNGVSTEIGEFLFVFAFGNVTHVYVFVEIFGANGVDKRLIGIFAVFTVLVVEKHESKIFHHGERVGAVSLRDELGLYRACGRGNIFLGAGQKGTNKFVLGALGDKITGVAVVGTVRGLYIEIVGSVSTSGESVVSINIVLLENDWEIHAGH